MGWSPPLSFLRCSRLLLVRAIDFCKESLSPMPELELLHKLSFCLALKSSTMFSGSLISIPFELSQSRILSSTHFSPTSSVSKVTD